MRSELEHRNLYAAAAFGIYNRKKIIDKNNDRKFDLKNENSSISATIEAEEKQLEDKKRQNEKNISLKDNLNFELNEIGQNIGNKNKELSEVNENAASIEGKIQTIHCR